MELIKIRNAHQGLPELLDRLDRTGIVRDSRNGPVIMFAEPTTIIYEKPQERVILWPERDANPFFHLMEFLWAIAGRRDVKFVEQFVKRMRTFSDDGKKFHAAYGYRWRKNFQQDQLPKIIEGLKESPDCRRQVLGIWDVKKDLGKKGLDTPCNLEATFQIDHENRLNMVVHNRSNDGICGALGANSVVFSLLQEYIAAGVGVPLGKYWQVSSNLHVYMTDFEKFKDLAIHAPDPNRLIPRCPYVQGHVKVTPVVDMPIEEWDQDLKLWMKNPIKFQHQIQSKFFLRTATPMFMAHKAHKKGDTQQAIEIIETQMQKDSDWAVASLEWLQRRLEKKQDGKAT